MTGGVWADQVLPWHDVYAAAASSSAALLGLLFVGLSVHVRLVVEYEEVRALARQTFTSFLVILVTSLCVLIPPTQGPLALGAELVAIGVLGAVTDLPGVRRAVARLTQQPLSVRAVTSLITRFAVGVLGLLGVLVVGALLLSGVRAAIDGLIAADLVLLIAATQSTWDLIVTVATVAARKGRHTPDG